MGPPIMRKVSSGPDLRKISNSSKENENPRKLSNISNYSLESESNRKISNVSNISIEVPNLEDDYIFQQKTRELHPRYSHDFQNALESRRSRANTVQQSNSVGKRSKSAVPHHKLSPLPQSYQHPNSNSDANNLHSSSSRRKNKQTISVHTSPIQVRRHSDTKQPLVEAKNDSDNKNRSYTVKLQPGQYKLNIEWGSKSNPFRITVNANQKTKPKREFGIGVPPKIPEPLLYCDSSTYSSPDRSPRSGSLTRKISHKVMSPHIQQFYNSSTTSSSQSSSSADQSSSHKHHRRTTMTNNQHPETKISSNYNRIRQENRNSRSKHRKGHNRLAEKKKNEGNELYKNKQYREALKTYTEAIELCPECAPYYSNRSACHMMLGKFSQALSDAREAVRLDSTFVKGFIRVAKCNVALGDANAALAILRQAAELDPNNKSVRDEMNNANALLKCIEEVEKAAQRPDYRMAIFHIDRSIAIASGCRHLKITKGEYLVYLQRYAEAQEIVNEILQFDNTNADALYVRGMCLYYQNNHENANAHFQQVLRLAPDHKKAKDIYKKAKLLKQKKEEGNQAFNRGQFVQAQQLYSEALAIDVHNVATNSKLYNNRATVRAKLGKLEEAVEDCTSAINLDESYTKAFLRRAKCYQDINKHEDAVRDYEKAFKLDRNQENKRLLHESKMQLKKSKWKDYYQILGVSRSATEDEIKKSYKKMALMHHPDRHASATEKEKHDHEVKFKEIGEAYNVLTDSKKKAMYDRGQDLNEPMAGFGCDNEVDPNQIFQAFFQGGGHQFGFQDDGMFGGGGFPGGNAGGFHFQFG